MALTYIKVFYDWIEATQTLSDAEKGRLITALVRYASTGEEVELSGAERHLYPTFRAQIDRDASNYKVSVANGSKGGRPKKPNKTPDNLKKPNVTQNNQDKDKDKDKDYTPIPPQGVSGRFDRFWAVYPKKVGKGAAQKAFERLKPDDALLAQMLDAIAAQRQSSQWQRDGGQYIPNPATWLNQARWLDEQPAAEAVEREPDYAESLAAIRAKRGVASG